MPTQTAKKHARAAAREGKRPSTQAGAYVREEMRRLKEGKGTVRSRRQAIAIGLSEARRAGVALGQPRRGSASLRRKAARDSAIGRGRYQPSARRSRGAKKAARTRARRH